MTAVGSGLLLFACPGDKLGEYQPVPFRVIDERTGRTLLTDGLNPFPSDVWGTSPLPEAIGHFWAAGDWPSARESHVWATPWRTGRGRYADTRRGVVLDLDLPSGRRRLCRPLLRGLGEERWLSDVRRILPAVVDGPWLLQGGFGVGRLTGPLVLKRCGARHERRLGDGGDAQLGAGLVSWRTDRRVVVLHLRDGARSTATLPPTGDAGWRLARVGRRVFATAPIGVSWNPSGYRLLSGRIAGP